MNWRKSAWVTIFWLLTEQSVHNKQNPIHVLFWYFVASSILNVNVGTLTKHVKMGIVCTNFLQSMGYICPAWTKRKFNTIKSVKQCQTWGMWTDTRTDMTSPGFTQLIRFCKELLSAAHTSMNTLFCPSHKPKFWKFHHHHTHVLNVNKQNVSYMTTFSLYVKLHIPYCNNVINTVIEN